MLHKRRKSVILCLDLGNTYLHGGLFCNHEIVLEFRKNLEKSSSSDEWGLFLKAVLFENNYDFKKVQKIAICSVVPEALYSLQRGCFKYFRINPFVLKQGVKTRLKINYRYPSELGADRIANSMGALKLFENKDIVIIDFGTAITLCAVSRSKEYLGGAILAGLGTSMKALEEEAAKLSAVEIKKPHSITGRSTEEGLQAGLYYGALGAVQEIKKRILKETFPQDSVEVIGTGGFSHLYKQTDLFKHHEKHLSLKGLYESLKLNT